ncbi:JmjC-domain-containing protein [Heliocybe sulcata]|uniref:[histone H3]-trimethyl-L-lysine(9) demethylase n=1 Tax=Heliocybe sulcata TaxID=5364 RepID=A0A5C3N1U2_9AGAM|nr:JmjC-domain-containing protein [Heliocybe sulcata]
MSSASGTPSLTPSPSRSPTPAPPPVQPDHFYGSDNVHLPPSPNSDGRTWLEPEDDEYATRGIPVFKPTMEEFADFEGYMNKIECWGMRSGIVKVVPPKEWKDALPPVTDQLSQVKLKNPIEQIMLGRGGLFRQQNMEKRRVMSVREWLEMCSKEDYRAPGVDEVGLYHGQSASGKTRTRRGRGRKAASEKAETAEPEAEPEEALIKDDPDQSFNATESPAKSLASPPHSASGVELPTPPHGGAEMQAGESSETKENADELADDSQPEKPKGKRRDGRTRAAKEAELAERAKLDDAFLESFDPHSDWLPPNTTPFDYTQELCQKLERHYWRNCGLGKPAWYGADMAGSLFTDVTKCWNVGKLPSLLTRLLPPSSKGLLGVNTPYLYFGMWRATFAWHVEDMDLFSINYIHFGAPKFWYAIPQSRAASLENTMRGYFPRDTSQCPQFLRHKSFLASPTLLSQSSCRPNTLVQHAGEFVITYPRGYHAGFNLGFNCAESVNFALDSWLELGRKAKACECINDSVRIDVDQLLLDRAAEKAVVAKASKRKEKAKASRKRKSEGGQEAPRAKKARPSKSSSKASTNAHASGSGPSPSKVTVMLKLPPKPKEPSTFPCCLCVSTDRHGLLRVQDPPANRPPEVLLENDAWMAHESCAKVVPETWVDEVDVDIADGSKGKEQVVFGVDGIVKDRWNLKCSACSKSRSKAHGAPIQCTKGKCPKAFHVACAREGVAAGIAYQEVREVEKEVVLIDTSAKSSRNTNIAQPLNPSPMEVDNTLQSDGIVMPAPATDTAPHVLKVIRKMEVSCLCPQHNPAVLEAKKASKMDKIRKELLALPNMARIKVRVSAGVFEVSLVRVIEETNSVEVLWDRGLKREFKWGSVVFGTTDGVVGQKPSEAAPEPEKGPNTSSTHVLQFSRPPGPAPLPGSTQQTPASTPAPANQHHQHAYPAHQSGYNYWAYQYSRMAQSSYYPPQSYPGYPYSGYAHTTYGAQPYGAMPYQSYAAPAAMPSVPPPPSQTPAPYYNQAIPPLQWKQPYIGPGESGTSNPNSNQAYPGGSSRPASAAPSGLATGTPLVAQSTSS